ncbi:MAG: hypothetical protein JST21_16610 [Bacteroidetes bacterium]|nr:hypothetical protein [Bacteroidota bacterium]
MNRIKQLIFTGWSFRRLLYLVMGILLTVQAFREHDPIVGMLAAFILLMAIGNLGCCGPLGCQLLSNKNKSE